MQKCSLTAWTLNKFEPSFEIGGNALNLWITVASSTKKGNDAGLDFTLEWAVPSFSSDFSFLVRPGHQVFLSFKFSAGKAHEWPLYLSTKLSIICMAITNCVLVFHGTLNPYHLIEQNYFSIYPMHTTLNWTPSLRPPPIKKQVDYKNHILNKCWLAEKAWIMATYFTLLNVFSLLTMICH